ncbi:cardiolipin synthase [Clostridium malenominatum]
MKKLASILLSRIVIFGGLILLQLSAFVVLVWKFSTYSIYFMFINMLVGFLVILWIINNRQNPVYKLAWIIPILLFPIFGISFYLLFGMQKVNKRVTKRMEEIQIKTNSILNQDLKVMENLKNRDIRIANQAKYIYNASHYPVYQNTEVEYFSSGELKFERLKEELNKAEHYIFLEYFIIEEGIMWNSILDILIQKAKKGVDVRVLYDDLGCLQKLPYKYNEVLEGHGIKCTVFNPFVPVLSIKMNNRDHRKIVVIDGHTAFNGGINLADEYINARPKFGHWKDSAVMIKGNAVLNFTVMFLTVWDYYNKIYEDYRDFLPRNKNHTKFESDGFVSPYGDSPLDDETVGEMTYLNIINQAKEYVYITTPYLILDNETVTALCLAAKKGVDVRIITPHIPDKKYVHMVTRGYYPVLMENGVKIYEYTPGFMHGKNFVADDEVSIVGTINLDYRSLYLHFECATWMYGSKAVLSVKEDFLETLEQCYRMDLAYFKNMKWYVKLMYAILRVFSPLM